MIKLYLGEEVKRKVEITYRQSATNPTAILIVPKTRISPNNIYLLAVTTNIFQIKKSTTLNVRNDRPLLA